MLVANTIVDKNKSQFDGEGNRHVLFQEIVDHRYDDTEVKEQDAFTTTRTRTKRHRDMTKVVEVLIKCKDGSTTWVTLKDTKN